MRRSALPFLLAVLATAVPAPCAAQGWWLVDLGRDSRFEYGCFDPCACPLFGALATSGRMTMFSGDVLDPQNPFFEYDVVDVAWEIAAWNGGIDVTGSGRYRRQVFTGEHQLTLDLSVHGGPPQHFDSGLVPGSGADDTLDIDISLHGEACFDSVFRVRATFRTTSVPGGVAALSPRAFPNPFTSATGIAFTTPVAGPVDVRVFDAAGRQVAQLARSWRPAGAVLLRWDGRAEGGGRAPAGVYLVRIVAGGRSATRRVALMP